MIQHQFRHATAAEARWCEVEAARLVRTQRVGQALAVAVAISGYLSRRQRRAHAEAFAAAYDRLPALARALFGPVLGGPLSNRYPQVAAMARREVMRRLARLAKAARTPLGRAHALGCLVAEARAARADRICAKELRRAA